MNDDGGTSGDRLSRRRYLGVLAAGMAGAAGCTAPLGSRPSTETPMREATAASARTETATRRRSKTVYTRVYEEAVDSLAFIRAFVAGGAGQGSGFVYPERGVVITNQHVVAGASEIELRFSRGEWRTGEVIGSDVYSDLAVLRVDRPPGYASALSLADREPVVGDRVVAIGSPFGLEKSLSVGVVSGVNRSITTEGGFSIPGAIQTDAAVNPGNSGGPLVTLDGDVVGVIRSGGGENIGFAISARMVERVVPALMEGGEYDHSFMGVLLTTVTPTVAEANGLSEPRGVLVVEVLDDGPSAGVLQGSDGDERIHGVTVPTGGDVIVALDGEPIESLGDLSRYLAFETRPGQTIAVSVIRDGRRREIDLTLGERPPPGRV